MLKLLLVEMKVNGRIFMRLDMAGMIQNKQKSLIFIMSFKLQWKIKLVELVSYLENINLYEVNTHILS